MGKPFIKVLIKLVDSQILQAIPSFHKLRDTATDLGSKALF